LHKIQLIPATLDHAKDLAQNLRKEDLQELHATNILSPAQILRDAVLHSDIAITGMVNDRPVFMFGVRKSSELFNKAAPWMLGSDDLLDYQVEFLKRCRPIVQHMRTPYKFLENYVDTRNKTSIKWLKWLGFKIHQSAPFGFNGEPFHRFTMEGKKYV